MGDIFLERHGSTSVFNFSFDDTAYFWGYKEPDGFSGNAAIAPDFDVCITCSSSHDVGKYVAVNANPLFLPLGVSPSTFLSRSHSRDIPVSFIGQCYGRRPQIVEALRSAGIPVQTFGRGWPGGEIPLSQMKEIYARSLINLGFGYIGDSSAAVQLKGRDFGVPLAGGLYLTSYNPELENYFVVGKEIDCYRNEEELIDKIRFYLERPELALQIGIAGQARCLNCHTWKSRFQYALEVVSGKHLPVR